MLQLRISINGAMDVTLYSYSIAIHLAIRTAIALIHALRKLRRSRFHFEKSREIFRPRFRSAVPHVKLLLIRMHIRRLTLYCLGSINIYKTRVPCAKRMKIFNENFVKYQLVKRHENIHPTPTFSLSFYLTPFAHTEQFPSSIEKKTFQDKQVFLDAFTIAIVTCVFIFCKFLRCITVGIRRRYVSTSVFVYSIFTLPEEEARRNLTVSLPFQISIRQIFSFCNFATYLYKNIYTPNFIQIFQNIFYSYPIIISSFETFI